MLNQFAVEIPTLPVDQCHSHLIRYLKGCCDSLSYRRTAEKGRQAFGTHMVYRETFFADPLASSPAPYPQELHQWNSSEEPLHSSTVEEIERPEQNQDLRCQSGPSAKDSVIFSEGDYSKNLWGRPTTIADFGSSLWQVPYTSDICLLEDKVQDRGMYLFAISYGSDAIDQRSGVGWFSGWTKIFVIYSWYFNAEFWSTRCEDCFSTEQNHPKFSLQKKNQSGGTKGPEVGPFPSWQTDCLLDLRLLPGHWNPGFCRKLCRPIHY